LNTLDSTSSVDKNTGMPRPVMQGTWNGIKLKDKFPVPNPKDVFLAALPNAKGLQTAISAAQLEMKSGIYWKGDPAKAVQVYSVPAFLMTQAVDKMEEVRKIGHDTQKEEQKQLILTVLSAVFAVVPFVGEIGAMAAGLGTLARMMSIMGFVGNTALSITDAVEHPDMAFLAITGILLGGLPGMKGRRPNAEDMNDLAKVRKGITGDVAKAMGKSFARDNDSLERIVKVCVRK